MIKKGIWIGSISGIILGLFLKLVEVVTSIKVYTLLLNVDFMPLLGRIIWPEWIEFLFHLVISVIIGIILIVVFSKTNPSIKGRFIFSFYLTVPTIFLYFPLTIIALKEVPEPTNLIAFTWWVIGHLIYFVSISVSSIFIVKRPHEKSARWC